MAPEAAPRPPPAWTNRESLRLGWFLLAAFSVIVLCVGVAYKTLGVVGSAVTGSALVVLVAIGLFVLRSGDRISEEAFEKGITAATHAVDTGSRDEE